MLEECHHTVGIIAGVTEGVTLVTPSEAETRGEREDRGVGFLALRAGKAEDSLYDWNNLQKSGGGGEACCWSVGLCFRHGLGGSCGVGSVACHGRGGGARGRAGRWHTRSHSFWSCWGLSLRWLEGERVRHWGLGSGRNWYLQAWLPCA